MTKPSPNSAKMTFSLREISSAQLALKTSTTSSTPIAGLIIDANAFFRKRKGDPINDTVGPSYVLNERTSKTLTR